LSTIFAGGVPCDFFYEKNVPWLKKGCEANIIFHHLQFLKTIYQAAFIY